MLKSNDSLDIDVKFMKKIYDTGYQEVGGHLSHIEADTIAIYHALIQVISIILILFQT